MRLYERDGTACFYCGYRFSQDELNDPAKKPCLDHVHPRSAGGGNDDTNLVVACRTCNCQKGAKDIEVYRDYLRRRHEHYEPYEVLCALLVRYPYLRSVKLGEVVQQLGASIPDIVFAGEKAVP